MKAQRKFLCEQMCVGKHVPVAVVYLRCDKLALLDWLSSLVLETASDQDSYLKWLSPFLSGLSVAYKTHTIQTSLMLTFYHM